MTHPNLPPEAQPGEWVDRRADLIVVGDRIAQEFLPIWGSLDAEAIFVRPYEISGTRRIFIAFAQDDGYHDSMSLLPESIVSVLPAPTGLGHSRADDGEPPQQIGKRVEPHTGGVVTGGQLVDETESGREPLRPVEGVAYCTVCGAETHHLRSCAAVDGRS